MIKKADSNKARQKRHARVRAKISGTPECPRLMYFVLQSIFMHKSLTT